MYHFSIIRGGTLFSYNLQLGIANRTIYHFVFATKALTNDYFFYIFPYFFIFFFRHAKRKTLQEVECDLI